MRLWPRGNGVHLTMLLHGDIAPSEARKHREGKPDLVARFGGISLRHDRRAVIRAPVPSPISYPHKELIKRLRKKKCELCEAVDTVTVHQPQSAREIGAGAARVGETHGKNKA
jgi:hypothetical protein